MISFQYRGNNMVWIGAEKNGGKFVHSENSGKDFKADWYDGQPDNFGSNGKLIFIYYKICTILKFF